MTMGLELLLVILKIHPLDPGLTEIDEQEIGMGVLVGGGGSVGDGGSVGGGGSVGPPGGEVGGGGSVGPPGGDVGGRGLEVLVGRGTEVFTGVPGPTGFGV